MANVTTTGPLISVVIPTRNRPAYLRQAIASAINQTYRNIEIIVRDNASGEETRRVVEEFSDPRISYLRHSQDVGQTRNVIGGCRDARGVYIANLHDDDIWEPDFLEKLVPPLEADPTIAISFSDHYIIDASGQLDPAMTRKNTHHWKRDVLAAGKHQPMYRLSVVDKSIPLSMASLMRRSAIDWDDVPDLPSCYDVWLMYLVCRDGQAGYYVPERLTRYRVHDGSETAIGRMRLDQGFLICCERMLLDDRMKSVWEPLQVEYARACTDLGITLTRQGRVDEGRPYLVRGLKTRWTLRSLALYGISFNPVFRARANGHRTTAPGPAVLAVGANGKTPLRTD